MKLFRRQSSSADVPPELQPYYGTSTATAGISRWQRFLAFLTFAIVLVLLALGGNWLWRTTHTHTSKTTPSSKSQVNQSPSTNNAPKPSGQPAQTPATGTTNNSAVQAPSGALPNTGG